MSQLTLERSLMIDAPVSTVWAMIADLDDYHTHTSTLSQTRVVAGEGEGAIRHCVDRSGNEWKETCTVWEHDRRYVVEVDVSTYPARYRALFRSFRGTWSVEPVEGATLVNIRFEARLRRIPGMSAIVKRLAESSGSELEAILYSYRRAVAGAIPI